MGSMLSSGMSKDSMYWAYLTDACITSTLTNGQPMASDLAMSQYSPASNT